MPTPTVFPIWMTPPASTPGAPPAVANDMLSYSALIAQGYTFGSVPSQTVTVAGAMATITQTPIQPSQPDPNSSDQDELA